MLNLNPISRKLRAKLYLFRILIVDFVTKYYILAAWLQSEANRFSGYRDPKLQTKKPYYFI